MDTILSNDKLISLNLSNLIPIQEIRNKIINLKNKYEKSDALDYHNERWETISSKYFRAVEGDRLNFGEIYSYVLDEQYYISNEDKNKEFYNETGISYQVRHILLNIISCPPTHRTEIISHDSILNCTHHEWRQSDDEMYSYLAECIMNKMNPEHRRPFKIYDRKKNLFLKKKSK